MARSEVKYRLKDPAGAMKDRQMAMEVAAKDPIHPDKLSDEKKSYLESIMKMSGDFEEMNTPGSKFQNQFIDIQLRDMYYVFTGKAPFEKIRLFDTYGKLHYPQHLIALSNLPGLMSDSACLREIEKETWQIETGRDVVPSLFRRAVACSAIQKYNQAFADYDSILKVDSSYVLAWFMRGVTRYGLIRLIRSLNDYEDQITIGRSNSGLRDQVVTEDPEQTLAKVAEDLTKAIELDPEFYFAYYNRGTYIAPWANTRKPPPISLRRSLARRPLPRRVYNRGLIYILQNETIRGCEDLSRAGELGIADSYRVIKRYCYK